MITCPECKGERVIRGFGCPGFRPVTLPCQMCLGAGRIPEEVVGWRKLGDEMRADRIARGLTLRKEAARRGIRAVELSEMERGIRKPVRHTAAEVK